MGEVSSEFESLDRGGRERLIDRTDPTPLYHQLYLVIKRRILSGCYSGEGTMPSELDLERSFGISRITVRRAMDELAREGLIERQQGRAARVLPPPRLLPLVGSAESELQNTLSIGFGTEAEVLECQQVPASPAVAGALRLASGAPVHWIVRLRRRNGVPFCRTEAFVPVERLPDVDAGELAATPLLLLLERAGARLDRIEQEIAAVPADIVLAERLEVAVGAALLKLVRVVYDAQDAPFQHITVHFRSDLYRYRLVLHASELGR